MIGDFNDFLAADQKRGGREHPRSLITGFTTAMNDCRLMDLGFSGEKITWKKSRGQHNWVQERLDRGLANQKWGGDLFSLAEVKVLEVAISDHLPLLL